MWRTHYMGFQIDAFELWSWRRFLRVPWTSRRSNQSILKENNTDYLLEALMLKLKLQSFGHLMQRDHSLEKTLMLGKIEGKRRKVATKDEMVGWHHWLNGHEFEHTLGDKPGKLQAMGSQKFWYDLATEQQEQHCMGGMWYAVYLILREPHKQELFLFPSCSEKTEFLIDWEHWPTVTCLVNSRDRTQTHISHSPCFSIKHTAHPPPHILTVGRYSSI